MNIESVAWISERKNLLFVFFLLCALIFYILYVKKNKPALFAVCTLLFLASLLSKAQAVCFPFLVISIDLILLRKISLKAHVLEKAPLFALSLFFGVLAIVAQKNSGYVNFHLELGYAEKLSLLLYSFSFYFYKLILPFNLKAFYPYPIDTSPLQIFLSILAFVAFIYLIYFIIKQRKTIVSFVILFYSASVVFIIQIIPLGEAITADRYAYLASIPVGLFLFHSLSLLLKNKSLLLTVSFAVITSLLISSKQRNIIWQTNSSFFVDLISSYPDNEVILNACASNYIAEKKSQKAVPLLLKAIRKDSSYFQAHFNLGLAYLESNNLEKAYSHFNKTLNIQKDYYYANYYLGIIQYRQNKYLLATNSFDQVIKLAPKFPPAHFQKALCLVNLNSYSLSLSEINVAIQLDQSNNEYWLQRAIISGKMKRFQNALNDVQYLISKNYKLETTYFLRALCKFNLGFNGCDDLVSAENYGNPSAKKALQYYCKH